MSKRAICVIASDPAFSPGPDPGAAIFILFFKHRDRHVALIAIRTPRDDNVFWILCSELGCLPAGEAGKFGIKILDFKKRPS